MGPDSTWRKPKRSACSRRSSEFVGRVEARDRQMIARGTQVLADGENIDAAHAEIAENLDQFFGRFAKADHHAALGDHAWRKLFGVLQQIESALVAGSRAHGAIKTRDTSQCCG